MSNFTLSFTLYSVAIFGAAAYVGPTTTGFGFDFFIGLAYGCGLAAFTHYLRTKESAPPKGYKS